MKIEYDVELTDRDMAKLSKQLHDKGMSLASTYHWGGVKEEDYGFVVKQSRAYNYTITIDGKPLHAYQYNVEDTSKALQAFFPHKEIEMEREVIEKTKKVWASPKGKHTRINHPSIEGKSDGNLLRYDGDDELVEMTTTIQKTNNNKLLLQFKILWRPDKVQRTPAIEANMVDTPLNDMGLIQKIVEGRLKLKQFGLKEEPTIDCQFNVMTESKSECTPDIIAKVREARAK
mgnify:CR=1 FL=1